MRRNKRSLALITEKFHYFNRPDVAFAKRIWQSGVSVVSEARKSFSKFGEIITFAMIITTGVVWF